MSAYTIPMAQSRHSTQAGGVEEGQGELLALGAHVAAFRARAIAGAREARPGSARIGVWGGIEAGGRG